MAFEGLEGKKVEMASEGGRDVSGKVGGWAHYKAFKRPLGPSVSCRLERLAVRVSHLIRTLKGHMGGMASSKCLKTQRDVFANFQWVHFARLIIQPNVLEQVWMQNTKKKAVLLRVLLSAQSGSLPLSTQRDSLVLTLPLHVHVHQVGPRGAGAGAAVAWTERAVAAASRRRAQGPGERAQFPGVGSHLGRGGTRPGGELQRLGSLQRADEAEMLLVRDRWSGGFTPMRDREEDGGVGEARDVQGVECTWGEKEFRKHVSFQFYFILFIFYFFLFVLFFVCVTLGHTDCLEFCYQTVLCILFCLCLSCHDSYRT